MFLNFMSNIPKPVGAAVDAAVPNPPNPEQKIDQYVFQSKPQLWKFILIWMVNQSVGEGGGHSQGRDWLV